MNADGDPGQIRGRLSVGGRFLLVLLLGLIPVVAFFVYWIDDRRQSAHETAETTVRQTLEQAASRHEIFHTEVRHTLEMLALPGILGSGSSDICSNTLLDASERRNWLKDAWVVDQAGNVLCATDRQAPAPELNAGHHERIEQSGFMLTGLHSDSDEKSFQFVAAKSVQHVETASRSTILVRIDVTALSSSTSVPGSPDDVATMSLDYQRLVITHDVPGVSGLVGTSLREHPLAAQLIRMPDVPTIGSIGDDVERILMARRLPELDLVIFVGLDRASVIAAGRRDLAIGAGIFSAIILLAIGIGWFTAKRLILDPVRKVRDTALSMAEGKFGNRVALERGPREIQEMARAFDTMADHLEGMALNDQLTGAPNRRHFHTYVSNLVANARPFAVLAIDLDGFKPINDRFGHAAGDDILRLIADRLSRNVGDREFFARIGGDEFVAVQIAADSNAEEMDAIDLGRRILEAISAPVTIGDCELKLSGSIGLARWPVDAESLDELLDDADRALYAAKAAGRDRIVVFDGSQPDTSPARRRLPARSTAA